MIIMIIIRRSQSQSNQDTTMEHRKKQKWTLTTFVGNQKLSTRTLLPGIPRNIYQKQPCWQLFLAAETCQQGCFWWVLQGILDNRAPVDNFWLPTKVVNLHFGFLRCSILAWFIWLCLDVCLFSWTDLYIYVLVILVTDWTI